MKIFKNALISAVICALLACMLSGCNTGGTDTPSTAPVQGSQSTTSPQATQSTAPTQDTQPAADLIIESYTLEKDYTDEVGNSYKISYHIPKINISSPDADRINSLIDKSLASTAAAELECMNMGASIFVFDIGYRYYINGDILSLFVYQLSDVEIHIYEAYNINIVTGAEVNPTELLNTVGISPDQFIQNAKSILGRNYDSDIPEDMKDEFYHTQYANTVSDSNVNLNMPMYLNEKGELCFVGAVYSLAGADYYYHVFNLADGSEIKPAA
ncbi:MAG: hypothetical protein J6L81_00085 [Clostridia bacterium]|nr:hypothetical protein [Clostridia bacterium]